MTIPPRKPVTAATVIGWIQSYCLVPDGPLIGQPVKLAPFQRSFIEMIYDNVAGTRRAILSMGRKNSKSTLAACLMLNHLVGPSARDRPNSQLFSTAQSLDQASIVYTIARKMVQLNPKLAVAVKIHESKKSLSCPGLGTVYRALSADSHRALGYNPAFVIHDELGQVRGPTSQLYDNMESGMVAVDSPLTVVISTQASDSGDLMSILIDSALKGHDRRTILQLHTCPTDCADFYSEAAIRSANPAFDYFQNRQELLAEADKARRLPSFSNSFKNLTLNMRVESGVASFLARDVWAANGGIPRDLHGLQNFAGLDLSSGVAYTAFVIAGFDILTGLWHVKPFLFLPADKLRELELDSPDQPLGLWAEQGHIILTPGPAIALDFVAELIHDIVREYEVQKIAYDPWGFEQNFRPCLLRAGFSADEIDEPVGSAAAKAAMLASGEYKFIKFKQNYETMSPALQNCERLVLEKRLRHGDHPALNACCIASVTTMDSSGNRKLDKKRARSRIDGMIALVMALAVAPMGMTKVVDVASLIG